MKKILCYGDSNTYGYIPRGNGARYDEDTRWTMLLSKLLGPEYTVFEEGLNGRTTIFDDNIDGRNGLKSVGLCITNHEAADLMIIMLGTNDTKTRFHSNEIVIANGVEAVVQKAKFFLPPKAKILLIAPPFLGKDIENTHQFDFDKRSREISEKLPPLYRAVAERNHCSFLNAADVMESSDGDKVHLTPEAHRAFAERLCSEVKKIIG